MSRDDDVEVDSNVDCEDDEEDKEEDEEDGEELGEEEEGKEEQKQDLIVSSEEQPETQCELHDFLKKALDMVRQALVAIRGRIH